MLKHKYKCLLEANASKHIQALETKRLKCLCSSACPMSAHSPPIGFY